MSGSLGESESAPSKQAAKQDETMLNIHPLLDDKMSEIQGAAIVPASPHVIDVLKEQLQTPTSKTRDKGGAASKALLDIPPVLAAARARHIHDLEEAMGLLDDDQAGTTEKPHAPSPGNMKATLRKAAGTASSGGKSGTDEPMQQAGDKASQKGMSNLQEPFAEMTKSWRPHADSHRLFADFRTTDSSAPRMGSRAQKVYFKGKG